jgi:DNA polymerase epsilon subunit 1
VANPVPRVAHPEWLYKKLRDKNDKYQQRSLKDMFSKAPLPPEKRLSLPGTQGRPARVAPPEPAALEEIAEEGLAEVLGDGLVEGLGGDLEDFGAPPASKKAKVATVRRKSRGLGEGNAAGGGGVDEVRAERDGGAEAGPSRGREKAGEAPPRERSPTPDREGDYAAWLEHKKRKWKSARAGKKKRRLEEERGAERAAREAGRGGGGQPPQGKKKPATGLGAFVRPSSDVIRLTWQILQIAPGRRPGEFTAWIVAGDKMLSVPLTVPRRFYLNKRTPVDDADAVGTRVSRTLPHARPSFNLLQIEVPEDYFHVSARTLATHLSDPDVEGVYETRVPLALNAVLQLGCVATVEQHARGKRLTDEFVMEDLRPKTAAEAVYLDPKKTTLSYVYLYHR